MRGSLRDGDLVQTPLGIGMVVSFAQARASAFAEGRRPAGVLVQLGPGWRRQFQPAELMAPGDESAVCDDCGSVFPRKSGSFRFRRCDDCRDHGYGLGVTV